MFKAHESESMLSFKYDIKIIHRHTCVRVCTEVTAVYFNIVLLLLLILLFSLAANGFLSGGSVITIRHN
jgi:hypothetical protein